MVDLLEVSLLSQFVIGGAGFLSDDSCFVKLFLEGGKLVAQLRIAPVDFRDLWQV